MEPIEDVALVADGPSDAPVIVVAGSLAASPAMWYAQLAAWRSHARVLVYRYPGHDGRAPEASVDSIEALARDLLDRLDRRGVGEFAFCGLSLGGLLGMQLAATTGRVRRLVVGNSRWYQSDASRAMWDQRIGAVRAGGMKAVVDATLATWLTEAFQAREPERADAVRRMFLSTDPGGYVACATVVRGFDGRGLLDRISCPVMIVSSDQDRPAPTEHLAELAAALAAGSRGGSAVETLVIADCAHLSSVEGAEAWTRRVGDFLGASKANGRSGEVPRGS